MPDDNYSRRAFLKKFAYLSTGALALSATSMACYGPPPENQFQYPMVRGMSFLDSQLNPVSLRDNQNVPVQTKFLIEFTEDMNEAAPTTVYLTDSGNVAAPYDKVWSSVRTLAVTPSADLKLDTGYTLSLGNDAQDARGYTIVLTENATATFKTIA